MAIYTSSTLMPSKELEKPLTKNFNFGKINLGNK